MTPRRKLAAFLAGLVAALGVGYGIGTFFDLGPTTTEPAPQHGGDHQ